MTNLDGVHIRQVQLAGKSASIEGSPNDPYFQNIEHVAHGFNVLTALACRHVPADGCILDIGANIGLSTIALARARPDGKIIAFEPSPVNAHFLRHNLVANNVANVTVMQAAVSDREGELAFHEASFGAGSHVVTDEHLGAKWTTVRVPMKTLDAVLRRQGGGPVAFAKIDAEGHEPNILAGARDLLQRDGPLLYMEFNAWCLNAFGGHSPAAFARALWRAFTVSQTDPTGVLSEFEGGPIDFLHQNLTQHGCVDDLVLQFRRGVKFPTLEEMSWPAHANALVVDLQRRIAALEASTSWTVTAPLRRVGRLLKAR